MKASVYLSDLRGLARMATDATLGVTDLVEAVHRDIARPLGMPRRGIAGLVYGSVRGMTRLVGGGVDALLAPLAPRLVGRSSWRRREALLAALNGVLGDQLEASGNPLAIPMSLKAAVLEEAGGKVVVLAHGLCMNDLQWHRRGHDHGAALARDLGYSPVYLHYNSGLHTSINGRAFADRLETLVRSWPVPVEELVIVGHSMGGLISRTALHYAEATGHEWPRRLRKIVFLGTPHHGAALERGGNGVDAILAALPYTARFARLGKIRSAGITDLRYGNLLDEDWEKRDRFEPARDDRRAVPLPEGVECYAAAATTGKKPGDLNDRLLGDGLVSVSSALGRHEEAGRSLPIPESRQWVGHGMNHMDLLSRPEVYDQIRRWLAE
ncbi:MAG TPA: alpha/beta fold hydrolase [Thermoanaerobaculia bacterium]|jgi:pimeloyl-ACP methyl ester carboxylesterase|nr:alpha/beta fold hydrolase [Thermoanaerobaculia bacterium]